MPIYELECEKCGKIEEVFVPRVPEDQDWGLCECGGRRMKIISRSSFILEGPGWYVTEYGKKASKKE